MLRRRPRRAAPPPGPARAAITIHDGSNPRVDDIRARPARLESPACAPAPARGPPPREPLRASASRSRPASASPNRATSPIGTSRPLDPSSPRISRAPSVAVATHGSPAAIASSNAIGSPSQWEDSTKTSNAGRISGTSPRAPTSITRAPPVPASTRRSRSPRNGPSPTTTRAGGADEPSKPGAMRATASTRSPTAFWGTSRETVPTTGASGRRPRRRRAAVRPAPSAAGMRTALATWNPRRRPRNPRCSRSVRSARETEITAWAPRQATRSASNDTCRSIQPASLRYARPCAV